MSSNSISHRLERRMRGMQSYIEGDNVLRIPRRLRSPYSESQWLTLGNAGRRTHVAARLTEELLTEDTAAPPTAPSRRSPRPEPEAVTATVEPQAPAEESRPEFVPGRSYLPCADGCGKWYRTRAERPGLRFCPRK